MEPFQKFIDVFQACSKALGDDGKTLEALRSHYSCISSDGDLLVDALLDLYESALASKKAVAESDLLALGRRDVGMYNGACAELTDTLLAWKKAGAYSPRSIW